MVVAKDCQLILEKASGRNIEATQSKRFISVLLIFLQLFMPFSNSYAPVMAAQLQDYAEGQLHQSSAQNEGEQLAADKQAQQTLLATLLQQCVLPKALLSISCQELLAVRDNPQLLLDKLRVKAVGETNVRLKKWLSRYFPNVALNFNIDANWKINDTHFSALFPLYDQPETLLFTQFGLRYHSADSRYSSHLGVGVRNFYPQQKSMLGFNTFFDQQLNDNHHRLGIGVEWWRDYVKLGLNSYLPISGWQDVNDQSDYQARPAYGFDIDGKFYLPTSPQWEMKFNYARYFGKQVNLFGKEISSWQHNPQRFSLGLSYTPFSLFSAGINYQDEGGKVSWKSNIALNYYFGRSWESQLSANDLALSRTLAGSRYDFVDRNYDMVLNYRKKQLITLTLPPKVSGEELSTLLITAKIESKYALTSVKWQADALEMAGGKLVINAQLPQQLQVTLPQYIADAPNHYQLKAVATDSQGNRSLPIETEIVVTPTQNAPILNWEQSGTLPEEFIADDSRYLIKARLKTDSALPQPLANWYCSVTAKGSAALTLHKKNLAPLAQERSILSRESASKILVAAPMQLTTDPTVEPLISTTPSRPINSMLPLSLRTDSKGELSFFISASHSGKVALNVSCQQAAGKAPRVSAQQKNIIFKIDSTSPRLTFKLLTETTPIANGHAKHRLEVTLRNRSHEAIVDQPITVNIAAPPEQQTAYKLYDDASPNPALQRVSSSSNFQKRVLPPHSKQPITGDLVLYSDDQGKVLLSLSSTIPGEVTLKALLQNQPQTEQAQHLHFNANNIVDKVIWASFPTAKDGKSSGEKHTLNYRVKLLNAADHVITDNAVLQQEMKNLGLQQLMIDNPPPMLLASGADCNPTNSINNTKSELSATEMRITAVDNAPGELHVEWNICTVNIKAAEYKILIKHNGNQLLPTDDNTLMLTVMANSAQSTLKMVPPNDSVTVSQIATISGRLADKTNNPLGDTQEISCQFISSINPAKTGFLDAQGNLSANIIVHTDQNGHFSIPIKSEKSGNYPVSCTFTNEAGDKIEHTARVKFIAGELDTAKVQLASTNLNLIPAQNNPHKLIVNWHFFDAYKNQIEAIDPVNLGMMNINWQAFSSNDSITAQAVLVTDSNINCKNAQDHLPLTSTSLSSNITTQEIYFCPSKAGEYQFKVIADSQNITLSGDTEFTATVVRNEKSLQFDPLTLPPTEKYSVDDQHEQKIMVTDEYANPFVNDDFHCSLAGDGATFINSQQPVTDVQTDATGMLKLTFAKTKPGALTINCALKADTDIGNSPYSNSINFIAGALKKVKLAVTAKKERILVADEKIFNVALVELTDQYSNNIDINQIDSNQLTEKMFKLDINFTPIQTPAVNIGNISGISPFSLEDISKIEPFAIDITVNSSQEAGVYMAHAVLYNQPILQLSGSKLSSVIIVGTPPIGNVMQVNHINPPSKVLVDTMQTIEAIVVDANGNTVANNKVFFTLEGDAPRFETTQSANMIETITDRHGKARVTISSKKAGLVKVSAFSLGDMEQKSSQHYPNIGITFLPGPIKTISAYFENSRSEDIIVEETKQISLRFDQFLDLNGNLIAHDDEIAQELITLIYSNNLKIRLQKRERSNQSKTNNEFELINCQHSLAVNIKKIKCDIDFKSDKIGAYALTLDALVGLPSNNILLSNPASDVKYINVLPDFKNAQLAVTKAAADNDIKFVGDSDPYTLTVTLTDSKGMPLKNQKISLSYTVLEFADNIDNLTFIMPNQYHNNNVDVITNHNGTAIVPVFSRDAGKFTVTATWKYGQQLDEYKKESIDLSFKDEVIFDGVINTPQYIDCTFDQANNQEKVKVKINSVLNKIVNNLPTNYALWFSKQKIVIKFTSQAGIEIPFSKALDGLTTWDIPFQCDNNSESEYMISAELKNGDPDNLFVSGKLSIPSKKVSVIDVEILGLAKTILLQSVEDDVENVTITVINKKNKKPIPNYQLYTNNANLKKTGADGKLTFSQAIPNHKLILSQIASENLLVNHFFADQAKQTSIASQKLQLTPGNISEIKTTPHSDDVIINTKYNGKKIFEFFDKYRNKVTDPQKIAAALNKLIITIQPQNITLLKPGTDYQINGSGIFFDTIFQSIGRQKISYKISDLSKELKDYGDIRVIADTVKFRSEANFNIANVDKWMNVTLPLPTDDAGNPSRDHIITCTATTPPNLLLKYAQNGEKREITIDPKAFSANEAEFLAKNSNEEQAKIICNIPNGQSITIIPSWTSGEVRRIVGELNLASNIVNNIISADNIDSQKFHFSLNASSFNSSANTPVDEMEIDAFLQKYPDAKIAFSVTQTQDSSGTISSHTGLLSVSNDDCKTSAVAPISLKKELIIDKLSLCNATKAGDYKIEAKLIDADSFNHKLVAEKTIRVEAGKVDINTTGFELRTRGGKIMTNSQGVIGVFNRNLLSDTHKNIITSNDTIEDFMKNVNASIQFLDDYSKLTIEGKTATQNSYPITLSKPYKNQNHQGAYGYQIYTDINISSSVSKKYKAKLYITYKGKTESNNPIEIVSTAHIAAARIDEAKIYLTGGSGPTFSVEFTTDKTGGFKASYTASLQKTELNKHDKISFVLKSASDKIFPLQDEVRICFTTIPADYANSCSVNKTINDENISFNTKEISDKQLDDFYIILNTADGIPQASQILYKVKLIN